MYIDKGIKNMKPIIGIVGKEAVHDENDLWHRFDVVDEFIYLVNKHGGNSICLLPTEPTMQFNQNDTGDDTVLTEQQLEDLKQQLDLCDGLILQGGEYSCQYEVELAKMALERDMPIIGTCAGFNNILRALGSHTWEDKTKKHSIYKKDYRHAITIEKDSLLYDFIGQEEYQVNSLHTMMANVEDVQPYARVTALSYDGYVEAFQPEGKRFVCAVKWHPEQMMEEEYVDKMFEAFVQACKEK